MMFATPWAVAVLRLVVAGFVVAVFEADTVCAGTCLAVVVVLAVVLSAAVFTGTLLVALVVWLAGATTVVFAGAG
jgi:hypothetical protein